MEAAFYQLILPPQTAFKNYKEWLEKENVRKKEVSHMLNWAITFLVIGLIAGLLGLFGIAGVATQIAWVLFVIFIALFLISLVMGRRPPV